MAHLEEDVVAGLHLGEDFVPGALVDEGSAAAAGVGSVGDVDAGGVEVVGEVIAPAEVGLVAGGGVADDEEGGERGVERGVPGDGGLGRCVRGLGEMAVAVANEKEAEECAEAGRALHGGKRSTRRTD